MKSSQSPDLRASPDALKTHGLKRRRVKIRADLPDSAELRDATWNVIRAENRRNPLLFRVGDEVAGLRLVKTPRLQTLRPSLLTHTTSDYVEWEASKHGMLVPSRPPRDIGTILLSNIPDDLPSIHCIAPRPTFTADGQLHRSPGFIRSSGTYQYFSERYDVPERPTADHVQAALSLIFDELLVDFPLVSQADKAAALALFLTGVGRQLIDDIVPMIFINKPCPGTGASLLLQTLQDLLGTNNCKALPPAEDDAEWRKRITSALVESPGYIWLDNLPQYVDSGSLASVLTARIWQDRKLGSSSNFSIEVCCAWAGCGNNSRFSKELSRRIVPLNLDAKMDRPWERDPRTFKHRFIQGWVAEHRVSILEALLTLTQNWVSRGMPTNHECPFSGYPKWAAVIGGILETCEVPGFLENIHEHYRAADFQGEEHRTLVWQWWRQFKDDAVTATQLLRSIRENRIPIYLGRNTDEHSQLIFLGRHQLGPLVDRHVGPFVVHRLTRRHASQYHLEVVDPELLRKEEEDFDSGPVVPPGLAPL